MSIRHSKTLSLACPYCDTKCQFNQINPSHSICINDSAHHIAYNCTNCQGVIVTKWNASTKDLNQFQSHTEYSQRLRKYHPVVGDWRPRVDLALILNNEVKADFKEAVGCYNNGFYNACMVMARRAIQQEMVSREIKGDNLYQQIESTGISAAIPHLFKNPH